MTPAWLAVAVMMLTLAGVSIDQLLKNRSNNYKLHDHPGGSSIGLIFCREVLQRRNHTGINACTGLCL